MAAVFIFYPRMEMRGLFYRKDHISTGKMSFGGNYAKGTQHGVIKPFD